MRQTNHDNSTPWWGFSQDANLASEHKNVSILLKSFTQESTSSVFNPPRTTSSENKGVTKANPTQFPERLHKPVLLKGVELLH